MRWTVMITAMKYAVFIFSTGQETGKNSVNAVSTFISVSQNINYADVDGNIGLQTAAGIPIREGRWYIHCFGRG
jgi:acyl-homoserine lactone acylase PvdQ